MPLINSGDAAEGPTAVVQCQLNNMRSNPEPLEAACEASAKIVERPWSNRRSDFSLCATMVAKRTIGAIEYEAAGLGQRIEHTADHRRNGNRMCQAILSSVPLQFDRVCRNLSATIACSRWFASPFTRLAMSALGHKRTRAVQKGVSALPPKATLGAYCQRRQCEQHLR